MGFTYFSWHWQTTQTLFSTCTCFFPKGREILAMISNWYWRFLSASNAQHDWMDKPRSVCLSACLPRSQKSSVMWSLGKGLRQPYNFMSPAKVREIPHPFLTRGAVELPCLVTGNLNSCKSECLAMLVHVQANSCGFHQYLQSKIYVHIAAKVTHLLSFSFISTGTLFVPTFLPIKSMELQSACFILVEFVHGF